MLYSILPAVDGGDVVHQVHAGSKSLFDQQCGDLFPRFSVRAGVENGAVVRHGTGEYSTMRNA